MGITILLIAALVVTLVYALDKGPPPSQPDACEAFLTGSHAYGVPKPDSDIDVVLRMDRATAEFLNLHDDTAGSCDEEEMEKRRKYGPLGSSLRFGRLNLVVVESEKAFESWRRATRKLAARRPVSREEAVRVIDGELCASFKGFDLRTHEQVCECNGPDNASAETVEL